MVLHTAFYDNKSHPINATRSTHWGVGGGRVLTTLYVGMAVAKLYSRSLSAAKLHEGSHCLQQTIKYTCITAASVSVDVRSAYLQNGSPKHYYLSPLERTELYTIYVTLGQGCIRPRRVLRVVASSIWRLQFWGGSQIFGKFLYSYAVTKFTLGPRKGERAKGWMVKKKSSNLNSYVRSRAQ